MFWIQRSKLEPSGSHSDQDWSQFPNQSLHILIMPARVCAPSLVCVCVGGWVARAHNLHSLLHRIIISYTQPTCTVHTWDSISGGVLGWFLAVLEFKSLLRLPAAVSMATARCCASPHQSSHLYSSRSATEGWGGGQQLKTMASANVSPCGRRK